MEPGRKALMLAVDAGEILLKNGAEIRRVQETIERLLSVWGLDHWSVYVIPNGIFAMAGWQYSEIRYVPQTDIHLGRVDAINTLSREVAASGGTMDLREVRERIEEAAAIRHYPTATCAAACGIGAMGFCYIFGGHFFDCLTTFVCGALLEAINQLIGRRMNPYMWALFGGLLVALLSALSGTLFPALSREFILASAILRLVPGVSFTTGVRDFFSGDIVSGAVHLFDACLIGVCIAAGVAVAYPLWAFISGGISWF